jgi:type II secretory pathway pseudopilin PulG
MKNPERVTVKRDEGAESGWALLGMILALMVIGVLLVSAVPSVRFAVQRDKEAEMMYRGEQMAEAIGKYYNSGQRGAPQLYAPPTRFGGYLLELKKLRDGVTAGELKIKFVRRSAMIDPMTNEEWVPVRARDPILAPFLQAYAAATGNVIPKTLQDIAGPPPKLQRVTPTLILPPSGTGSGTGSGQGNTNQPPGSGQPGQPRGTPGQPETPPVLDDDDNDDDDDDAGDTLSHIFKDKDKDDADQPGKSSIPIVGVRPKLKGPSVRALYGLSNYEQWVFIYIPDPQAIPGANPGFSGGQFPPGTNPNFQGGQSNKPKTSQ